MALSNTQFWLISAAILIVAALAGWAMAKWMSRNPTTSTYLMWIGGMVLVGALIVGIMYYYTMYNKTDQRMMSGVRGMNANEYLTRMTM